MSDPADHTTVTLTGSDGRTYPAMRATPDNTDRLAQWARTLGNGQGIDRADRGRFRLHHFNGPPETGAPGDWLLYNGARAQLMLAGPDRIATDYTREYAS